MSQVEAFIGNFKSLPQRSKFSLFAGLAVIIALMIIAIVYFTRTNYSVLFSELEPQDAASIVQQLDKQKVNYKLADGGSKILVDNSIVRETRLKVIDAVPALKGGVGFEIFDKDNFGTTEFAQKINYQRALQGELARTIMSLSEVKYARVHLVLPTTSIFKKKNDDSRASVTLVLRKKHTLTRPEVSGIQKLVASSTPGLLASHVTILDQHGVVLSSEFTDNQDIFAADKKLRMKREVENYLTQKAQAILNQTLGATNPHVSIDATLDFNNLNITREKVIAPDGKNENITRRKETRVQGNKKQADDSSRSTIEVNYELGRQVEHIVSTPGSIKKLSIAIVVPKSLNSEQHDYVKSLVGNSVGYDKSRGDQIAVTDNMMQIARVTSETMPATETVTNTADMAATLDSPAKFSKPGGAYQQKAITIVQSITRYAYSKPMVVLTFLSLFILIFLFLLIKTLLPRPTRTFNQAALEISEDEKQQLLVDLRSWLSQESK